MTGRKLLISGNDGRLRCWWIGGSADLARYHDQEWGLPVIEDSRLFEKLCLEGFQSGLSWLTILRKREAFRRAFAEFDIGAVSRYGSRHIARLLADADIVRHRGKIESTINNARRALELVGEFGSLAAYVWQYAPKAPTGPRMVSTSPEAIAMSKDLKRRGWSFVGPTTVYSFMQAMGLVNDHREGCVIRPRVESARRRARRRA